MIGIIGINDCTFCTVNTDTKTNFEITHCTSICNSLYRQKNQKLYLSEKLFSQFCDLMDITVICMKVMDNKEHRNAVKSKNLIISCVIHLFICSALC
jgi:hypothetical protein